MPAGQVIGRVSVKVLPDTDDFRRQAERQLNKIEKTLEMVVSTKIDMSGASRGFLEELRKINARNRMSDSRKIRFHTIISTDGMNEAISKAVRQLNDRAAGRSIKIDADISAVGVSAELDKSSLKQVERDLEHWRRENSPIKVQVQPELMPGAGSIVSARLAVLSRPRTVPILPTLDEGAMAKVATGIAALSGGRVVADWMDEIANSLLRMDKSVPMIGSLALAIAGLAGFGLSAASNLAALSVSLAQIGPAALALPGILGGIAVGLGVSFVALRDFNKELPGVKKQLTDLQNVISTNFWKGFKEPMQALVNELLPKFIDGMTKTATQLGQFFGGLATSLSGSLSPLVDGMFADLAKSIDIFTSHTSAIANIIATLGKVGAGYLPQLADWLGKILDRFSNFLTAAEGDGRLKNWIDTGIAGVKDLGRVLGNIGGILGGIGKAASAAGGSSLGMMADTLERVNKIANSPGFQKGLITVLSSAHLMMSKIADGAGPGVVKLLTSLVGTFKTIAPIVGSAIGELVGSITSALSQPALQNGLVQMFTGLATAIHALAPAFGPVARALGSLGPIIGALAVNIATLAAAAFTPLANAIALLAPKLTPLINQLGPILTGVVKALAPVIALVGQKLGEIMVALGPLLTQLGALIALILPVLIPVLKLLVTIIADSLIGAITGITLIVQGVIEVFTGLINFFKDIFTGQWGAAWQDVLQIVSGIWDLIKGAFLVFINVGIFGVLGKGMALIKGLWREGWTGLKTLVLMLWDSIKGRFSTFMSDLAALPGAALFAIKKLFSGVWGDIKAAVQLAWDGIKTAVGHGIGDVLSKIKGLPGAAVEALGDIGSTLIHAGEQLIGGFIRGIGSMFGKVAKKLGELTGKLTSWKGPESLDRVILVNAGQLVIEGFLDGLESRYDAVRKSLSGFTAEIGKTEVTPPSVGQVKAASGISAAISGALSSSMGDGAGAKVLNYYAAPGSSLGSEEDLFAAASRSRMVGW